MSSEPFDALKSTCIERFPSNSEEFDVLKQVLVSHRLVEVVRPWGTTYEIVAILSEGDCKTPLSFPTSVGNEN